MKSIWMKLAAAALLIAGLALGAEKQDTVERQLKAARNTEIVDGNLKAAIEQYKKVAQSGNRSLAAQALLYMAECYRKLGDAEAQRIYRQVVRDYADQKDAAAAARAHLGQDTRASSGTGDRVVFAGDSLFGGGRVSPDGRYLTDVDYNWTGNLVLHDLVTGKDRALTGNKDWTVGNASTSTFSPDGKQIAYGWRTYATPESINDLRVISIEGGGLPQPRRIVEGKEVSYYNPSDWSRDGKWLAGTIEMKDMTKRIAIVNVADGATRILKTVGWRGPERVFFSPDGKYITYNLPANEDVAQRDVYVMTVDGQTETAVVQSPAFDIVLGWSPDGAHLIFASDRTGSMGVWAVRVVAGKAQGTPVLLKPNIGPVGVVGMTPSGSLYVIRDASTIALHVASIDLQSGKLAGQPGLQSLRSQYPEWSPTGELLAYGYTGDLSRGRLLSIRSMITGQTRELQPAIEYFRKPTWSPDSKSLIVPGRDFKGRFGLFQIDAATGATSVINNTQTSRAEFAPDGKKLYYQLGNRRFVEHDLESGKIRDLFQLPGTSWELSPDGRFVALISADAAAKTSKLTVIPVAGGEPREIYRLSAPEELRPSTDMSWTPDGMSLLVVKTIGDRDQKKELWLIPVSEGAPRKLDIDISDWSLGDGIRLHRNGRQIAFFAGKSSAEAWVYEKIARR